MQKLGEISRQSAATSARREIIAGRCQRRPCHPRTLTGQKWSSSAHFFQPKLPSDKMANKDGVAEVVVDRHNSLQPKIQEEVERDEEEYDDPELYIPKPPDGGWGWVIVFASFMCNLIVDGIAYSFGVLFPELVSYFGESKSKTAWVGALLSGCYMCVGPIVSALTNKYGCRPVTIAGSVVGCIAFFVSQFAPSITVLMITFGVMGGIGFGLIYLPAIVSVGYYFEKKRALATGIAVCGSGMGTFILAPFTQVLLDTYGWKGTVVIMAGFILNCMVLGALMRPLDPPNITNLNKPLLLRMAEEKKLQMERGSICGSSYFVVQLPDGTYERRPKFAANNEPGVHSIFNLDQFGKGPDTPGGVGALPTIAEGKVPERLSAPTPTESPRPLPLPSAVRVANGIPKNYSTPTLEGMVRRNTAPRGLANGALMKMTQSNATVDGERRKQSLPVGKVSSNNLLTAYGPSRNNNCSTEEVWVKVSNSNVGSTVTVTDKGSVAQGGPSTPRADKKAYARPMYRKDIFYSGSIVNLPEYTQSQKDMGVYRTSVMSIPRSQTTAADIADGRSVATVATTGTQASKCCSCLSPAITDTMSTMLDFSLISNPVFLLICISNVFGMLGFYVPFVYIADMAMLKGIEPSSATFLLSVIGITNTFGRIFFGWFTDRPSVDSLLVNNVCLLVSGVCIFIVPFGNTYWLLVIICVCFGLFVSAYISLTSIILVDLLGLDKLTNAFGLLILFRGGASIIGVPLAGAIYDAMGSYDVSFYVAGGLIVVSAILSFMIPFVKRLTEKHSPGRAKFTIAPEGGDGDVIQEGGETIL